MRLILAIVLCAPVAALAAPPAPAAPLQVPHYGRLLDATDTPANGALDLTVSGPTFDTITRSVKAGAK